MRMQSLDRLDANDALMLGLVGKQRGTRDVADRIDARHVGFAGAVDDDHAALGFHAEFFQAEIFDVADDTDGGDDALDGKRLRAAFAVVDGRGNAVGLLVEFCHFGAGENFYALLLETLARESGDLGILGRQDLWQHLDTVTSEPSVR